MGTLWIEEHVDGIGAHQRTNRKSLAFRGNCLNGHLAFDSLVRRRSFLA